MRRRGRRCHLNSEPAAGISYSAAGLIKYSRARVVPHDYPYFVGALPGVVVTSTPTHCLETDLIPVSPSSTTELQNES